jgi:glycosyltransferase involved in cell wall biosynthesis
VHTHLTPASFYTNLVLPESVPQVHTIHSTYSMDNETRPLMRLLEKKMFLEKRKSNIICLSEFAKEDFLRAIPFKGKVFVLNNFVADRFFENTVKNSDSNKKQLRLLAVGSLKPLKNFEYLLEIFEHLKGQEIYLDIYGEGTRLAYEDTIKSRGLKVRMMGRNDNMAAVYPDYDLFIMPSRYEGFPLSLFEAMASGIPLLLSDIAPLRSIVKDHALYFSLDDVQGTVNTISGIFENRTKTEAMAIEAKKYATHTVKRDIYIKNLLSIYEELN